MREDAFPPGTMSSPKASAVEVILVGCIIAVSAFLLGLLAERVFNSPQMHVIRPLLASIAVFAIFTFALKYRTGTYLLGEIGFVYMALALAYTLLPAIKFLMVNFDFPSSFDGWHFAELSPQPGELGTHFWRHALFIFGVAAGFLAVRIRPLPIRTLNDEPACQPGRVIAILLAILACCVGVVTLLSAPVATYLAHYTRFDHLSAPLRRLVDFCLVFKDGGYFVLLALLFSQYRRYRRLIFMVVPIVCVYEVAYSKGTRIVVFTFLLAVMAFYHYRVSAISLKKGLVVLLVLATLFLGIEIVRGSDFYLGDAQYRLFEQKQVGVSEFDSVYCTGFHLYFERAQKTLPSRNWQMFFYELIAVIPLFDHTEHHPQYWYARNYFPNAIVPPTTMGVIADSAIWGGEMDLFIRSLLNGMLFAFLTRWFLRRREKWWALTIYIYLYATCIVVLKYSVFFQIAPLIRTLLPPLLLAGILIRWQKASAPIHSVRPAQDKADEL